MAESYTVLARRYRSQNFDELVGQEPIAQTLKNAISSHRVAHAFLFTGTRGVGKTSAARILAKALNCPNTKENFHEDGKNGVKEGEEAAGAQPCGKCDTCLAIARGEDMDVIEIDGASNNGVDQVRELRQNAGIRPARSPYKIYIIDEVHMLSTGAFNALLKTLEEPPSHVKFIFATTDVHKVPATILSRVQRFDFKNIPTIKIAEHLTAVCQQEKMQTDPEAILRIARLGNGSMRDALSLLDRVLSLGETHVTEKLLDDLLGKPPTAALAELVESLASGDAGAALTRADALLASGMGPEQLLSELIDFFRNLMLISVCGPKSDLLEVTSDIRPRFVQLAASFDAATLVHLIALCEQTHRSLKSTTMARPLFDALLVRLAMSEQFASLRGLLQSEGASAAPASAQKKNDMIATVPSTASVVAQAAAAIAQTRESIRSQFAPATARPVAAVPSSVNSNPPPAPRLEPIAPATNENQELPDAASASPPDPSDLPAVWRAVRHRLVESKNGSIEVNLGSRSRLESLDAATGDTVLAIAAHMSGYASERIRFKIEEALAAVVARPIRLALIASEELSPIAGAGGGAAAGGGTRHGAAANGHSANRPGPASSSLSAQAAARRVPPELESAVRNQPTVRAVLEKLGGHIQSIEILETPVPNSAAPDPEPSTVN